MKFRVELEHTDWQSVLNLLAQGRYDQVAPLIGKISEQLRVAPAPGNGQEVPLDTPGM